MAPLPRRQLHHSFSVSCLSANPHAGPINVTRYISFRVLIQLFAGTICIFVLGVLFWKIGKFLRYLTRHRVVRGGKTMHTRYARTWYGWVSFHRYESKKRFFQKCFQKVHEWTAWKSSSADYRWIWWDPGQKEMERYKQRRLFSWLPKCLRSYEPTPADPLWNPGPPVGRNMAPGGTTTGISCRPNGDRRLFRLSESLNSHYLSNEESISGLSQRPEVTSIHFETSLRRNYLTETARVDGRPILGDYGSVSTTVHHSICLRRDSCLVLFFPNRDQLLRNNFSMPCLLSTEPVFPRLDKRLGGSRITQTIEHEENKRFSNWVSPRARVYQKWSARMESQAPHCMRYNQGPLFGPPGSPNSELLASFTSERTALLGGVPKTNRASITHSSSDSTTHAISMGEHLDGTRSEPKKPCSHDVAVRQLHIRETHRSEDDLRQIIGTKSPIAGRLSSVLRDPCRSACIGSLQRLQEANRELKLHDGVRSKVKYLTHKEVTAPSLSNWELRLMTDLDRKLMWLANQLSPGRRPFHFALLANHWLNRETWVVLDPISRVPSDAKRQCGDPRFNSPYPAPSWKPMVKHADGPLTKRHKPHLNSWRVAVNRNRRMTGLQSVIKSVALWDGSADEPPDGKVDPASWILRRPPQGFAISTRQKNVYYEGGAGWQETLSDWQKVRRGYRIRKVIYEGRANRTRMKEVAVGIVRYCRSISSEIRNDAHRKATAALPGNSNNS
ncbi:uncharacterized protein ACLA_073670 [Aspergillus clavatus NRRL 1]|uniref:Uncharacterized protein n=1 Tax=Aspergillus clavatus (strain ATCC 1007 / CBS 513.65 / DSM 816 / NCTC 3887 / NRRL 1 / QM 1276 / 107) TaxID=344612 RepID=A1C7G1_ASPCL|nr:uncharacterized protein ACLA_073670 [Aspergillus clavatus NRRL 1]EAW14332.1 hypothetical protein ACLA_073670 [Aspergillus clavatus NRRL 1]